MRVVAIGMFAVATICGAGPASAQIAGSMRGLSGSPGGIRGDIVRERGGDPTLRQRVAIGREVDGVRDQIRDGREAGQLSRREARALRREGLRIEATSRRFARGGYSDAEVAMLRSRTEALRSATVAKRSQKLGK